MRSSRPAPLVSGSGLPHASQQSRTVEGNGMGCRDRARHEAEALEVPVRAEEARLERLSAPDLAHSDGARAGVAGRCSDRARPTYPGRMRPSACPRLRCRQRPPPALPCRHAPPPGFSSRHTRMPGAPPDHCLWGDPAFPALTSAVPRCMFPAHFTPGWKLDEAWRAKLVS